MTVEYNPPSSIVKRILYIMVFSVKFAEYDHLYLELTAFDLAAPSSLAEKDLVTLDRSRGLELKVYIVVLDLTVKSNLLLFKTKIRFRHPHGKGGIIVFPEEVVRVALFNESCFFYGHGSRSSGDLGLRK